jgi:hypothetical protein
MNPNSIKKLKCHLFFLIMESFKKLLIEKLTKEKEQQKNELKI